MPNPPFPLMPHRPGYALVGDVVACGGAVSALGVGQRVFMQVGHGTVAVADVREETVFALPDALADGDAVLVRLAYIALSAVRVAPLQLGETVVVYGLGLVGQFAAQLFKLNGARTVIGVDRIDGRLAVVEAHGAVAVHGDGVDVREFVLQQAGGQAGG